MLKRCAVEGREVGFEEGREGWKRAEGKEGRGQGREEKRGKDGGPCCSEQCREQQDGTPGKGKGADIVEGDRDPSPTNVAERRSEAEARG